MQKGAYAPLITAIGSTISTGAHRLQFQMREDSAYASTDEVITNFTNVNALVFPLLRF